MASTNLKQIFYNYLIIYILQVFQIIIVYLPYIFSSLIITNLPSPI